MRGILQIIGATYYYYVVDLSYDEARILFPLIYRISLLHPPLSAECETRGSVGEEH